MEEGQGWLGKADGVGEVGGRLGRVTRKFREVQREFGEAGKVKVGH